jgi:ABC-2 type transport system permease protein
MSTLRVAAAFLVRDFRIVRSYRFPFVLDSIYGVLNLAIYFFLSRTFDDVDPDVLNGAPDYFAFAAVGAILALVMDAATDGVAEKIRDGQVSGTLENLATQPVSSWQLCSGLTAFPFAFAMVRSVIYLGIAAIWSSLDLGTTDWLGFGVILALTASTLAALGVIAGAAVLIFKRGQVVTGLAVFGMSLVSGAVFPASVLPDWLEIPGRIIPLRLTFDGARSALFLGEGWTDEAVGLLAFSAIGLPLAVWVFTKALTHCRRAGSLAQY